MVPEVEDKEGPSTSELITKKVTQPANPGSSERMTTPEGNILDIDTEKGPSASSVEESTPGQAKSETAVVELNQDQSLEATTGETTLDQTIPEAATEGTTPGQTTSEEAVGGAEVIQTSCTDNQTPPTSPVQGATPQISPSKLIENLRTLELNNKAEVRPTTPS